MIYFKKRQQYFWSSMIAGLLTSGAVSYLGIKLFKIMNGQTTTCGCAVDVFNSPWFLGLSGLIILLVSIGFMFGLVKLAKSALVQRRLLQSLRFVMREDVHVRLFQQDALQAFCYGFLHPKIAVSTGILQSLSSEELKAVISHEQAHQKSHEPLKILVGEFVSNVFYFIPLIRQLFNSYKTVSELAADEAVANDNFVGKAIIHVSNIIQSPVGDMSNFAAALDARIQRIIDKKYIFRVNFSGRSLAISLFTIVLIGIALFWNPEPVHAHNQQCQMQVSACHEKKFMPKWEINTTNLYYETILSSM